MNKPMIIKNELNNARRLLKNKTLYNKLNGYSFEIFDGYYLNLKKYKALLLEFNRTKIIQADWEIFNNELCIKLPINGGFYTMYLHKPTNKGVNNE